MLTISLSQMLKMHSVAEYLSIIMHFHGSQGHYGWAMHNSPIHHLRGGKLACQRSLDFAALDVGEHVEGFDDGRSELRRHVILWGATLLCGAPHPVHYRLLMPTLRLEGHDTSMCTSKTSVTV